MAKVNPDWDSSFKTDECVGTVSVADADEPVGNRHCGQTGHEVMAQPKEPFVGRTQLLEGSPEMFKIVVYFLGSF